MSFNPLETTAKAAITSSVEIKDSNELYVNPLEVIVKKAQHACGAIEDIDALLREKIFHAPVIEFFTRDLDWIGPQRTRIMATGVRYMRNKDFSEAAYQYKRELFFSEMASNAYSAADDEAARAGLKAIKRNATAKEIYSEMLETALRLEGGSSKHEKIPDGLKECK